MAKKMNREELIAMADSKVDEIVKIAGTKYDRRRKVTNDMIHRMNQMKEAGKKVGVIAEHFGVSTYIVKYHTDPEFKANEIMRRGYYGQYTDPFWAEHERAIYKRNLLADKSIRLDKLVRK